MKVNFRKTLTYIEHAFENTVIFILYTFYANLQGHSPRGEQNIINRSERSAMKRVWKKAMGGALAAALTLGIMPAPAQAEETGAQTDLPAPVLYASFDNGNAEDSSGNGNNGTVIGTPEFVDGVSGKAVHIVNSEDIAGSGADAEP